MNGSITSLNIVIHIGDPHTACNVSVHRKNYLRCKSLVHLPEKIGDSNQSNLSLKSLYYAEACNEFAGPSRQYSLGQNSSFEEKSSRWQAVGNTESNLVGSRFESLTFRSRDQLLGKSNLYFQKIFSF